MQVTGDITEKEDVSEVFVMSGDKTGGKNPHPQNKPAQEQIYFTQRQLAERWHVSQGTIINMRRAGKLPVFPVPGTNRILFPVHKIELLEKLKTINEKETTEKRTNGQKLRRKKPVISDKPTKVWRV